MLSCSHLVKNVHVIQGLLQLLYYDSLIFNIYIILIIDQY